MMFRNVVAFFMLNALSAGVTAQVTINTAAKSWQYPNSVRLETVLAPLVTDDDIYWSAAVLYQVPATDAEHLRLQLLQLLADLQLEASEAEQQLLLQLAAELKSWRLAKPLPFAIDFDRARLDLASNPLLLPGEYYLTIGPRPLQIYIVGAVKGAAKAVPHRAATPVKDYLSAFELLSADPNQIMLLQADRHLLTVPLTGARASYQEAQPGAVVVIPFKSSVLNGHYHRLNQLLVELVQYRVAV